MSERQPYTQEKPKRPGGPDAPEKPLPPDRT